jgi:hypothetical protein
MKDYQNMQKLLVTLLVLLVELQKMVNCDGGVMAINILYSLLCSH